MYTPEPEDKKAFTQKMDLSYSRAAGLYDTAVRRLPVWRNWILTVLPYIQGERVLEVSFGTGYLLAQYAEKHKAYGIDYNWEMVQTAKRNLEEAGKQAHLVQADVENLPFPAGCFDTLVNTMSFSGYPDGARAMAELYRLLGLGGRLLMVDVNFPEKRGYLGMKMAQFWVSMGDILRDMGALFGEFGFDYTDAEIGGFGSVHLYTAIKNGSANSR